jgi:FKBP-type peptidyl-prolyl cis-trans isomerase
LSVNLSNTSSLVYTQGFREGVLGMHLGEKKVLIVPPNLGYAGSTASIANDTLYYDVQLINF